MQDHRNIARLLVYMGESVQWIKEGNSEAHILLLRNCVEYLKTYPEEIHHPKENAIFDQLGIRDGVSKSMVDRLLVEHQYLARKTKSLCEVVNAIECDQIVSHQKLVEVCADYVEHQFRHMRDEEDTVFPLIEQKLTVTDWKSIIRVMPAGEDPLFSKERKKYYDSLYSEISNSYQYHKAR